LTQVNAGSGQSRQEQAQTSCGVRVVTQGEMMYLALVLATFGGFGSWLFWVNLRYDRMRGGRPEAKRFEAPAGMGHAVAAE
jgi:hypothetical protein